MNRMNVRGRTVPDPRAGHTNGLSDSTRREASGVGVEGHVVFPTTVWACRVQAIGWRGSVQNVRRAPTRTVRGGWIAVGVRNAGPVTTRSSTSSDRLIKL